MGCRNEVRVEKGGGCSNSDSLPRNNPGREIKEDLGDLETWRRLIHIVHSAMKLLQGVRY